MTEDEAFLNAVVASPEDDAPRLIHADWLDERGDPRGEFIRLNAEIEKFEPHCETYGNLRSQLKALRTRIDPAWARTMGYVPRHRPLFGKLPTKRQDRWRLVEEFIESWHRPLTLEDGISDEEIREAERRLGLKLPAALCEWYRLAGRRRDVWSRQDDLVTPEGLQVHQASGTLIIRYENQGCERWGIPCLDLNLEDPPIVEIDSGEVASPTTSAFACVVMLYGSMFSAGVVYAGGEIGSEQVRAAAIKGLRRSELPERYWVLSPLKFFEGTDLIVATHCDLWVYVMARTENLYLELDSKVREQLEVYRP